MLTRDQAIEAAFYAGANLLSFTDKTADNLGWIGVCRGEATKAKKAVALFVLDNKAVGLRDGYLHDEGLYTLATMASSFAIAALGVSDPFTPQQVQSYFVFVTVLLACDRMMAIEARAAELLRVTSAPPAFAGPDDEDDRIDRPNPDPMEPVDWADKAFVASPKAITKPGKSKA